MIQSIDGDKLSFDEQLVDLRRQLAGHLRTVDTMPGCALIGVKLCATIEAIDRVRAADSTGYDGE